MKQTVDLLAALRGASASGKVHRAKADRRTLKTLCRLFGEAELGDYPSSEVWCLPSVALRRMRHDATLNDETVAVYDGFMLDLWSRVCDQGLLPEELTNPDGARLAVPPLARMTKQGKLEHRCAGYLAEALAFGGIRADQLAASSLPANIDALVAERFPNKDAKSVLIEARRHFNKAADRQSGPDLQFPRVVPSPTQDYAVAHEELPPHWRNDLESALEIARKVVPVPGRTLDDCLGEVTCGKYREEVQRLAGYAHNIRGLPFDRWRTLPELLSDLSLIKAHVEWHIRMRKSGRVTRRHKLMVTTPANLLRLLGHEHLRTPLEEFKATLVVKRDHDEPDPRRTAPDVDPHDIARQTNEEWIKILARAKEIKKLWRGRVLTKRTLRQFCEFCDWVLRATMADLLLREPMRSINLRNLRLGDGETVGTVRRDDSGVWHLCIPNYEVKNQVPIRRVLPLVVCEHLSFWFDEVRARIPGARKNPLLFIDSRGKPLDRGRCATKLGRHTKVVFGTRLTTKDFRPLAAIFYWMHQPDDVETVKRLLRHKTKKTTLRYYIVVAQRVHCGIARRFVQAVAEEPLRSMARVAEGLLGRA